jgi:uncharacterized membrane protein
MDKPSISSQPREHIYHILSRQNCLKISIPLYHKNSSHFASMMAVVLTLCLLGMTFGSEFKRMAYAQEDSSSDQDATSTTLQDDRTTLSEIKNMTTTEMAVLKEINVTSTKLATQGAYTALSVFFLGIGLVIFGLRLTAKGIGDMGKYLTLMIWAVTIPVIILVAIFQFGIITNIKVTLAGSDEPFFLLSFLMYIPIAIVLFLLFKQRSIAHSQSVSAAGQTEKTPDRIVKIFELKERGAITDEEFQKLKTEFFSRL